MIVLFVEPSGRVEPALIVDVGAGQTANLVLFITDVEGLRGPGVITEIVRGVSHSEFREPSTWHYIDKNFPETN
jgi:hypothetical protein